MKKHKKIWIILLYVYFLDLLLTSIYYIIRAHSIESFLMLGISVGMIVWFRIISIPVESRMVRGTKGKGWD